MKCSLRERSVDIPPEMTQLLLLSSSLLLEECLASSAKTGGPYTRTIDDMSGSCIDNRGQIIQEGRLFEPGPDECQVCTCLRHLPVHCRTVLCAPPQGCRSLRSVSTARTQLTRKEPRNP